MDQGQVDFGTVFADLAARGERERTTPLGGVDVRLVRVPAGGEGRWDSHADTAETVVVWSGEFTFRFRDRLRTRIDLTPRSDSCRNRFGHQRCGRYGTVGPRGSGSHGRKGTIA